MSGVPTQGKKHGRPCRPGPLSHKRARQRRDEAQAGGHVVRLGLLLAGNAAPWDGARGGGSRRARGTR
eukprot:8178520-Pyramimonas_sp.AAC.1